MNRENLVFGLKENLNFWLFVTDCDFNPGVNELA